LLGKQQQETLYFFFDTITTLLAESHKKDNLAKLRDNLNNALAMLERDFPVSVQVLFMQSDNQFRKSHINRTSPLICCIILGMELKDMDQYTLYTYERFSWLSRRALNQFRPEATITNAQ